MEEEEEEEEEEDRFSSRRRFKRKEVGVCVRSSGASGVLFIASPASVSLVGIDLATVSGKDVHCYSPRGASLLTTALTGESLDK